LLGERGKKKKKKKREGRKGKERKRELLSIALVFQAYTIPHCVEWGTSQECPDCMKEKKGKIKRGEGRRKRGN